MVEMMEYLTILSGLVGSAVGYHATHTAAGLGDVAEISGDEVKMHVEDGLSGGRSRIDANVITIRCVSFIDDQLNPIQQLKTCRLKFRIQVKKISDMLFGDDQHMSGIHRKCIIKRDGMFIFQDYFPR
jgi:hypothetical protein